MGPMFLITILTLCEVILGLYFYVSYNQVKCLSKKAKQAVRDKFETKLLKSSWALTIIMIIKVIVENNLKVNFVCWLIDMLIMNTIVAFTIVNTYRKSQK